ncbi:hypothetical protein [Azospirillum sp. sgz302134]
MGWISPTASPQPLRSAPPRPQPGQDVPTQGPLTDNPDLPTPGPQDDGPSPIPNNDLPPSRPTDPDFA